MVTAIVLISLLRSLGAAEATDKTEVLATIGEEAITLQDVAELYPGLVASIIDGAAKIETAWVALGQTIMSRVLAREAQQSGLANRPAVQAKINDLLAQEYLNVRLDPKQTVVTEAESQSYYDQHRERFKLPPRVRLAHILVASEAEAQTIWQAAQGSVEAFSALARERSLDPGSAPRGGSLGWVVPALLVPPLAEAALALEPGQVSGVIKTDFGYHLVRLEEKPPPAYQPYAEVQRQLQQDLAGAKRDALMKTIQEEMWAKYRVTMDQEAVQKALHNPHVLKGGSAEVSSATSAPSSQRAAKAGPQPKLRVLSAAYDLGTVPVEAATYTMLVMNSGEAELVVQRVHTSCRCVLATLNPMRLLPGQMGKLTVVFDPQYFREDGKAAKIVYVQSNDPEEPRKDIRFTVEMVQANEQR